MTEPTTLVPQPSRSGAKTQLLTVLGEFVLPGGGSVWTAELVRALGALGIGEANARQAIARTAEDGMIAAHREGRAVRWELTAEGRRLLEEGADRIYGFGRGAPDWNGDWLLVHCPVAETMRRRRDRLRTRLAFLGAGELSPSLFVSPHVGRDTEVRTVLAELGLDSDSVVLRAAVDDPTDRDALVARAWDLAALATEYATFVDRHGDRSPTSPEQAFVSSVELVDDWRRFPFVDPELPTDLLPEGWVGAVAADLFHRCRDEWSDPAREWFHG